MDTRLLTKPLADLTDAELTQNILFYQGVVERFPECLENLTDALNEAEYRDALAS